MKKIKNIFTLFLITVFFVPLIVNSQSHYCYYRLSNYSGSRAVLYQMKGDQSIPLDTTRVQLNAFVFPNIERYPVGMYRISFDDTLYTELVFNNEDIVIEADAKSILNTMVIKKSVENIILFDYWNYAIKVRDSIVNVSYQREKLVNSGKATTKELKVFDDRIEQLNDNLYEFIETRATQFPDQFAPVILRSYLIPSYQRYLKEPGNEPYPTEKLFYLYHFFDNIDFSDARLLNTRIIHTAISDYMANFAKPAKTAVYKDVIDRVLSLSKSNEAVYSYSLNLFIQAFDNSIWEDVFIYLIDNYYLKSYSYNKQQADYYSKKVDRIKSLRLGEKIPNVILKDTTGSEVSLYSVKAKAKLVLVYSSDCSHCKEVMPDIQDIYTAYKDQGFEVYSIAIDDSLNIWKSEIINEKYEWISVSDLKGLRSPLLDLYNIWMTPTMFMLDEKNVIVNKPRSEADIHATLLQLLKMNP